MPASGWWSQGGLGEVGGGGRGWVSKNAAPSTPAPCCSCSDGAHGMGRPCSHALVLPPVCTLKRLLGSGARSLGIGGCLWCEAKGELLCGKQRTSEEIVTVWKKAWMLKCPPM